MQKILMIFLLFVITANCRGIGNMKTSIWRIKQSTSNGQLFKEGMIVDFVENSIRFSDENQFNKYPAIISQDRIVIEIGHMKWLFEIESSDSVIILRELYSKNPVEFSIVKINNLKKEKS